VNDLRRRAIGLLARREHSRAELVRKLAADGPAEEIDTVLAQLEAEGLLSDARFAEAFVRAQAPRLGKARLKQALREKGIAGELANDLLGELPSELERAREVWTRKFAAPPCDTREWARQARFLQSRGFSQDVIVRLLKEVAQ
jgi:regulatory protein